MSTTYERGIYDLYLAYKLYDHKGVVACRLFDTWKEEWFAKPREVPKGAWVT